MKKTISVSLLVLVVLFFASTCVFAESQGMSNGEKGIGADVNQPGQGTDQGQQIQQKTQNNGDKQTITIQQREQVRASNSAELGQMMQQRQQQMNQELQGLETGQQNIYQNQNKVRLAVHSLIVMEDLVGRIGPQVREIARDFNNSVQTTVRAEEKVQERNWFMRFLFGGDEEAAGEIEQEVNTNRERIQTLKQLKEQCSCDEPVRTTMQEQIQNIEQEQNRLQQLAQAEKQSKGLLGWLWK